MSAHRNSLIRNGSKARDVLVRPEDMEETLDALREGP